MLKFINYIFIKIIYSFVKLKGSSILYSWIRSDKKNDITFNYSKITDSRINVEGFNNIISLNKVLVQKSSINIKGNNNKLFIENDVILRNITIIIRGENCKINIRENTTFGGARIINVGTNNDVEIGKNCLFSDKIEIWSSDTHSIFDENKKWINKEKSIEIGDNVWVGTNVSILKGVNIGSNSVIGLGTIVTNDVPPSSISVGNPNKTIKKNINWSLEYPI